MMVVGKRPQACERYGFAPGSACCNRARTFSAMRWTSRLVAAGE
jgi:hypothetical protein